jgi:hypothetical protein
MITKTEDWQAWVDNNKDPYGKACIDVARKVMELLDEREGDFDCKALVTEADDLAKAGGITGFMAGCVAQMVSHCHSRGDEFRRKWNISNQIGTEGEKANEGDGVLNPAILNLG